MRWDHLARWTEAQTRFDGLRRHALAKGGARFADLSYANLWEATPLPIAEAISNALDAEEPIDLQYTPYGGATVPRRIAAHALRARTGLPFRWSSTILTPGAMSALSVTLASLEPGNVVIPVPTWLDHPLYAAAQGHEPRLVPLARPDLDLDLEAIADAIDEDTRAVILACPGNPTGRLYGDAELAALGEVLSGAPSPPLLMSDECHRDFVFGERPFVSPATCYPRCVLIYSYGKRMLVQGQRLGYVAVSPEHPEGEELAARITMLMRALGHAMPSALMQRILPSLEQMPAPVEHFSARRRRVIDALRGQGYRVIGDATMFLYVAVEDDWATTRALADRGVLVLPSSIFHDTGHLRLSLSASDAMIDRALECFEELAP